MPVHPAGTHLTLTPDPTQPTTASIDASDISDHQQSINSTNDTFAELTQSVNDLSVDDRDIEYRSRLSRFDTPWTGLPKKRWSSMSPPPTREISTFSSASDSFRIKGMANATARPLDWDLDTYNDDAPDMPYMPETTNLFVRNPANPVDTPSHSITDPADEDEASDDEPCTIITVADDTPRPPPQHSAQDQAILAQWKHHNKPHCTMLLPDGEPCHGMHPEPLHDPEKAMVAAANRRQAHQKQSSTRRQRKRKFGDRYPDERLTKKQQHSSKLRQEKQQFSRQTKQRSSPLSSRGHQQTSSAPTLAPQQLASRDRLVHYISSLENVGEKDFDAVVRLLNLGAQPTKSNADGT